MIHSIKLRTISKSALKTDDRERETEREREKDGENINISSRT